MFCCPACIGDDWLGSNVISERSSENGICPTCGNESGNLVEAQNLRDEFEIICGIYIESTDGKPLFNLMKEDWGLFERLSEGDARELLKYILGDSVRWDGKYRPHNNYAIPHLNSWLSLKDELKHVNRFFPETDFDLDRLRDLLELLVVENSSLDWKWYRARIEQDKIRYGIGDMGAPPKKVAGNGRANPVGIPYLYIASEIDTAIAEVRPHPGDIVCIAEFELPEKCKFVDLRSPRKTVSPFMIGIEEQVGLLRRDIEFLEGLGEELKTPILPSEAAIEYVPSQFLCELIKNRGFHGVLYASSVGSGVNLAMFEPNSSVGLDVSEYYVNNVVFNCEKII